MQEHHMAHYRVYLLNTTNQIIQHADLEAPNDAAAWKLAHTAFADLAGLELWSGKRLVGNAPLQP